MAKIGKTKTLLAEIGGEGKNERMKEKRVVYQQNFESVRIWVDGVNHDYSGSEQTTDSHLNALIKFCERVGKNPDELIKERIGDSTSQDPRVRNRFELILKNYVVELKKDSPSMAHNTATSIKSFFSYNFAPLYYKAPRTKEPQTKCPSKEAMEKLYWGTAPGQRARISVAVHSGARRGSLCILKYKHIKEDFEAGKIPLHVHFEADEVKGKRFGYDAFLGKQAVEDIRIMLEERKRGTRKIPPETITDESPLFRKENIASVEALDEAGLTQWYATKSRDVGLPRNEWITPHGVRRFTQTAMEKSNRIPLNWIDHLIGHRPRGAQGKHYSKPAVEELRVAWAKAESFLTLNLTPEKNEVTPTNSTVSQKIFAHKQTEEVKPNSDQIELKSLEHYSEPELKSLHDKSKQVQQSMNSYLTTSKNQNQSLKIETPAVNANQEVVSQISRYSDCEQTTMPRDSYKISDENIQLLATRHLDKIPYNVKFTRSKDEAFQLMEEKWEYIKRFPNGFILLVKENYNLTPISEEQLKPTEPDLSYLR